MLSIRGGVGVDMQVNHRMILIKKVENYNSQVVFVLQIPTLNSVVAKIFSEISFSPLHLKGNNGFFEGHRTSPLVSFAPPPSPPPRRGEGRVGVMFLMCFCNVSVNKSTSGIEAEFGLTMSSFWPNFLLLYYLGGSF
jgi:hypothetical protein